MVQAVAAFAGVLAFSQAGTAQQAAAVYAITGARVFTAAGQPLAGATVLVQDGVIANVGTNVTVPAHARVIDGAGLNVYPGLIDMNSSAPIDTGEPAAEPTPQGRGGRGGGRGGGGSTAATLEEAERDKRDTLLQPHYVAAANLRTEGPELQALANAGVTTVLAVQSSGIFKGQSALVNVAIPPGRPHVGTIGDYRQGLAVVKSPVATHINMGGRAGGPGYPNALLGLVAFTRQSLYDAQWQRDSLAHYWQAGSGGQRPQVEPALDALRPALARELPAAFDASNMREIDRALAIAKEFGLDPIVVGASEAAQRVSELAAAKARVIYSVNLPGGRGGGAGAGGGGAGGRGGGGGSLAQRRVQDEAPKTASALAAAGIPYAFTSGGGSPADFVRNIGRVIKEGGLSVDAALRAVTIDAARLAGAADRVGSIERGKVANLVVTDGDIFDGGSVKHVFVDGYPVDLTPVTPAAPGGRGGRGGGR
jgi:imidazolonepropionase-like amidohydrolase